MKHGGLLTAVLILILCSLLGLASVSAADLTNDTLDDFQGNPVIGEINNGLAVGEENNGDCLYVSVNGNSYANATSWGSATNSLDWAIYLAKDNTTIYIDNGTYSGSANSKINIAKSVNIVGSANTVFDGLNKNYFFTISDGVTVSISNIMHLKKRIFIMTRKAYMVQCWMLKKQQSLLAIVHLTITVLNILHL